MGCFTNQIHATQDHKRDSINFVSVCHIRATHIMKLEKNVSPPPYSSQPTRKKGMWFLLCLYHRLRQVMSRLTRRVLSPQGFALIFHLLLQYLSSNLLVGCCLLFLLLQWDDVVRCSRISFHLPPVTASSSWECQQVAALSEVLWKMTPITWTPRKTILVTFSKDSQGQYQGTSEKVTFVRDGTVHICESQCFCQ